MEAFEIFRLPFTAVTSENIENVTFISFNNCFDNSRFLRVTFSIFYLEDLEKPRLLKAGNLQKGFTSP